MLRTLKVNDPDAFSGIPESAILHKLYSFIVLCFSYSFSFSEETFASFSSP